MCAEPWSGPNLPLQAEVPPASHPGPSFQQTGQRWQPAAVSPSVPGTAAAAASAGASAGAWLHSPWCRGPGFCSRRPVGCWGSSKLPGQQHTVPKRAHGPTCCSEGASGGRSRGESRQPYRELLSLSPCVTTWGPAEWLSLHGEVTSRALGGSRVAFCWQLLYLACSTDGSKSCLFALVKSTSRGG